MNDWGKVMLTETVTGAPRALVRRHVETLAILGELRRTGDGKYHGTVAVAA